MFDWLTNLFARRVSPDDPGREGGRKWQEAALEHALWTWGISSPRDDTVSITPASALQFSAVWACVRIISQTIASLGWHTYQTSADGRSKEPLADDISWVLGWQANPEVTAYAFREALLKDALLCGNGFAEIQRDLSGRVMWLWRISPERVTVARDDGGSLVYLIDNGTGKDKTVLPPADVYHLRGLSADGVVGYSVVETARRSLSLAIQTERYGESFFKRGPLPGGVLKIPGNPKKEERDSLKSTFEKAYGGAANAGRIIVTTGNMEFAPLEMSNEDAQFLESRRFSINEVARWFGVPPHKLGDLERATFSNIEHQAIEFVQDCIFPWCRRLESEADVKLYGRKDRGRKWTKLNLNALLRGDSATQTANITSLRTSGLITANEGREQLDMNPVDGGDELLVQGAMTPSDGVSANKTADEPDDAQNDDQQPDE